MLRRQLPVHSPTTVRSITAGVSAAALGDREGRLRERLGRLLAARYDARDVLLTDSGTSALMLAIAGAIHEEQGPVAMPGYTCYDMASAAEGAGAEVLLYDVDPETLGPDLDSLAELQARRPAAVVVGHLFGHLVDLERARGATGNALLIEDAAQAVGGSLNDRPLGSFGSVSILSFGRGKGMTGGGGGALLALDDRGAEIIGHARRRMRSAVPARGAAGMVALAAQHLLGRPSVYWIPASMPFLHLGETRYHPPVPPRPMATASMAALERILPEATNARDIRRAHATRLRRAVDASRLVTAMSPVPDGEPGHLRLPVLLTEAGSSTIDEAEARHLGIARGYPTTLLALPSLRPHLTGGEPRLPGSATLAERLVTLPTHGLLTEHDLSALEEWLER